MLQGRWDDWRSGPVEAIAPDVTASNTSPSVVVQPPVKSRPAWQRTGFEDLLFRIKSLVVKQGWEIKKLAADLQFLIVSRNCLHKQREQ